MKTFYDDIGWISKTHANYTYDIDTDIDGYAADLIAAVASDGTDLLELLSKEDVKDIEDELACMESDIDMFKNTGVKAKWMR